MNPSLKSLLKLLGRLKLDVAVIVSKANKLYFTGYGYDEGYLVINNEQIKLFVDPRFSIYAKHLIGDADVIETKNPAIELSRFLKKFRHIGVDGSTLLYTDFMHITSVIGKQRVCFIHKELLKIRAVKNIDEVYCIKKAANSAKNAISILKKKLKPYMTEKQIAAMLNLEIINAGADDISFDTVVAFDKRAAYAHAIPSNDVKLSGKQLMLCDFGAVFNGYHSDETHTFFLNKWNSDAKKLYNAVLNAHNMAIDAIKAGMRASRLDKIARDFLEKQGYGKFFGHALGHGVGLDIHESPTINYNSTDILKNGMIFTIEPGVYIPNWGGIRIESMVYLTNGSKEILTGSINPIINLEV